MSRDPKTLRAKSVRRIKSLAVKPVRAAVARVRARPAAAKAAVARKKPVSRRIRKATSR